MFPRKERQKSKEKPRANRYQEPVIGAPWTTGGGIIDCKKFGPSSNSGGEKGVTAKQRLDIGAFTKFQRKCRVCFE